jgi:hypothetical protein
MIQLNQLNNKQLMIKFDLSKLLKEEIGGSTKDLVTRPTGQAVRERIERDLEAAPDGSVIGLDFSKVGVIDYSCADEIAAKLLSRLLSGEYGDKYLVLTGMNENQRENIEVALERKDLAIIAEVEHGARAVLGSLNNYLKDTLEFVVERKKATARELTDAKKIEANTSGTRLLNLYKKRLVRRVGGEGALWAYEAL